MKFTMKQFIILLLIAQIQGLYGQPNQRGLKVGQGAFSSDQGKTYAIVIGISNYKEVADLKYADQDAAIFADYLLQKNKLGVDSANLLVFLNEKATLHNIGSAISSIIRAKPQKGDRVLFFFAGHGDYDAEIFRDQALLLLHGAPPKNYFQNVFSGDFISTTDLNSRFIEPLNSMGCQVVLIIDACHAKGLNTELSGGKEGGRITTLALSSMTSPVKIYSCNSTEFSLEGKQWGGGRGLFSYVLMEGLYGLADGNNDHIVTYRELQRYLEDNVPKLAAPNRQEPMVKIENAADTAAIVDMDLLKHYVSLKEKEQSYLTRIEIKSGNTDSVFISDPEARKLFILVSKNIEEGKIDEAYRNYTAFQENYPSCEACPILSRNLSAAFQEQVAKILEPLNKDISAVRLNEKDLKTAESYLEKAAALLGKDHYLNNKLKARILFLKALGIIKNANYLATAPLSQKDTLALQWLLNSKQLETQSTYTIFYIGYLYGQRFEMYDSAFKYFEQYASMIPKGFKGWGNLAMALERKGEYDAAIKTYNRALSLCTNRTDSCAILVKLAISHTKQLQYKEAEKLLDYVILHIPSAGNLSILAAVKAHTGNFEEAIKLGEKAITIDPNHLNAIFNMACIYSLKGNIQAAILYLEKALKKGFKNLRLLTTDNDLNNIRSTTEFKTLIQEYFTKAEISAGK
jgi:tetratricopeptide (TPR) repeat protein